MWVQQPYLRLKDPSLLYIINTVTIQRINLYVCKYSSVISLFIQLQLDKKLSGHFSGSSKIYRPCKSISVKKGKLSFQSQSHLESATDCYFQEFHNVTCYIPGITHLCMYVRVVCDVCSLGPFRNYFKGF